MLTEDLPTRPRHPVGCTVAELGDRIAGQDTPRTCSAAPPRLRETRVTGITLSSQRVSPGDLYAALPGSRTHGIAYLPDALAAGAVAVLTDEEGAAAVPAGVPGVVVANPRSVLGGVSARVYGDPARQLTLVGVTGTQGKTTATRLAEGGLLGAGVPAAVVGTVGTRIAEVATSPQG